MEKIIEVGGRELPLKTNAGLLRRYRDWFKRDLTRDMTKIENVLIACTQEAMQMRDENGNEYSEEIILLIVAGMLPIEILDLFEDVAFAMAKYADPTVPDSIEEWLENFETFDIFQIFPELVALWQSDSKQLSDHKKK